MEQDRWDDQDRRRPPTGRVVAISVAALLVIAACSVLGVWQWQRGHVVVTEPPAQQPITDISEVVDGGASGDLAVLAADEVGRPVEVRGSYDPDLTLLAPGRPLDGALGSWVIGIVVLEDGSGVPVVRGWLPDGAEVPATPTGQVDLEGVVQPPEASDIAPSNQVLPAGQTWVVSAADLVNRVDYPVANAYVTLDTPEAGLQAVPPDDPGQATRRLDWGNLAYAAQWWVFALFAVVIWFRAVRDERIVTGQDDPGEPQENGPANGAGGRDMSGAR